MTKEELEARAFTVSRSLVAYAAENRVVELADALTYGDSRYREGLEAAAKAMCQLCQGAVSADEPFLCGVWWRHAGGVNCSAGPIHDLIAKMEEDK